MTAARHLAAVLHLVDRAHAEVPPGRDLIPADVFHDVLLDIRNAVEGAYVIELLEIAHPPQRLRRPWLGESGAND